MSKRRKTKAAEPQPAPTPAPTPSALAPAPKAPSALAPAPASAPKSPSAPAPATPASTTPAPATPAPVSTSIPLLAAAGLTLFLALLATDVPGHRFPALYDTGRFTLAIGALLTAVAFLLKDRLAPSRYLGLVRVAPLLLVALGLSALVARHGHDFRLFATAHSGLFGAAPELALIALTAGLALRAQGHRAHAVPLGLGLGLLVALFLAPDVVLGAPLFALPDALGRAAAPFAVVAALLAVLALLHLVPRMRDLLPPRVLTLAPAVLAVAALVPALASDTPLVALAFVAGLATLHLGLVDTLATSSPPESEPTGRVFHRVALLAVLGLWLLLKAQALIASNTDENIYFYMAKILADGQWPYADYFFAHPPLHVVLPGALFATFGFSLTFAKVLPLAFCFIGGLALHATLARHVSRPAALLTLILYLFAAEVLKASSNMTGVNMTTMFLLLGTWQALSPRPFTAGILLGLAPATGFYAMAPALAVLAMCAFRRPDASAPTSTSRVSVLSHLRRLRLAQPLAFILTLGGINLIFWALGGDTFLEGVYSYHQQKFFQDPKMVELFGGDPGFPASIFHNLGLMLGGSPFIKEVFYHPHLWLGFLLVPLVLLGAALASDTPTRRLLAHLRPSNLFTSADGHALFLTLVAFALLVQFAMFRELYSFYFALIYPFLAAATGWATYRAFTLLKDRALGLGRPLAIVIPLAALSLLAAHPAISLSRLPVFEDEIENAGARNAYEWTAAPVLDTFSPLVKNLFWEDFRFKGDVEPGYRHYLWTKKRGFTRLDEVAAEVARLSRPEQTIAGSSTLAPLVALVADRRLAANEADTNNKRFRTGILKEADYWNAACRDDLQVIVAAPRSYFTFDKIQNLPLVRRYFGSPTVIEDRTLQYRAPFPIALFPRGAAPCAWIEPTSPTSPSTSPDTSAE